MCLSPFPWARNSAELSSLSPAEVAHSLPLLADEGPEAQSKRVSLVKTP